MKVAVYSTKAYDREFFGNSGTTTHQFTFLEPRLLPESVALSEGHEAVCVFVHDIVNREVLSALKARGCRLVAVRAAGFNNVDLDAAKELGITVSRVPAYSPDGVAEFTVGLMMTLNRGMHRAHDRIRRGNFSLDGLMGFNFAGKTVGIIGTGKIGQAVARLMNGFRCRILAHDRNELDELKALNVQYTDLNTLLAEADIVTLHVPLFPETRHLINAQSLAKMKRGAMLINTSRGELVQTSAVIEALKSGQLGYLGVDVYEDEEGVFFEDLTNAIVADDQLMRLTTFPNVLLTSHQAFFTREAMEKIIATTLASLDAFAETGEVPEACRLT
jgi:D-lactate dehydrogenase